MLDNYIELRNLSDLSGLKFFIPNYQRGYRWTTEEVCKMLDDFKEFKRKETAHKLKEGEFYCLQPIVVKKRDNDSYEVLDGQQRLTTLFLLMTYLKERIGEDFPDFSLYSISYETRKDSSSFLENISEEDSDADCVDFFYIKQVYNAIVDWFKENENSKYKGKFPNLLLEKQIENGKDIAPNVRIIWYEIGKSESSSAINIFTRLNIGKIPLTNAELIKALFLRKSNFVSSSSELSSEQRNAINKEINLKQQSIATEWNTIEQKLQDESFWYFLRRTNESDNYETHIEYLFDLISEKGKDSEFYHSFNFFNEKFEKKKSDAKTSDIDTIDEVWGEIKKYFQELEYWYNDRKLYHYVGFLIECGVVVSELKKDASDKNKKGLVAAFENKIKKRLNLKFTDLDNLSYGDNKVRQVFLLFNILSVISDESIDTRFPFDKYKKEKWDIEHIHSQSDNVTLHKSEKDRKQWVNDMLSYFLNVDIEENEDSDNTDLSVLDSLLTNIETNVEKKDDVPNIKRFVESLIQIKKSKNYNDASVDSLYNDIRIHFFKNRIPEEEKNLISNLALLNADINRSYHDAFFPVKRMLIKKNDMRGRFIPLATKNVFMKYYSKNSTDLLIWTSDDAKAYFEQIKNTLSKFLS